MATDRALMQQALEALSHHRDQGRPCIEQTAYDALRARLAEPVACHKRRNDECACVRKSVLCDGIGPEPEPVAWAGLDLDSMAEAFHRCIEAHAACGPFHQPVNADAMLALRELRAIIPAMKAYTVPPTRSPLTEEEIKQAVLKDPIYGAELMSMMRDGVTVAQLREAVSGIARAIERKITGGNDE